MPAGAVPLQLFDRVNSLLQNHLLFLKSLNLLFGLLQFRFLRLQGLDLVVLFGQLSLPGVVQEAENNQSHGCANANEHHGKRAAGVHCRRPP